MVENRSSACGGEPSNTNGDRDIAIVGISCRLPGMSDTVDTFWDLLSKGVDGVVDIPRFRWHNEHYYNPDPTVPGKLYVKQGGFIQEPIDLFDESFFGIGSKEAEYMDPQHRLLLEVSWEAIEDAGLTLPRLKSSMTGVLMGICTRDYNDLIMQEPDPSYANAYVATGNSYSTATGRISYMFDLRGISSPIDTACSSASVSAHLACRSLRRRETDIMLVGGVNLSLGATATLALSKAQMLSPDSRCKSFDADANGYVRGEACIAMVFKRLHDAIEANDRIYAIIKGSAVNQDGASAGLTVPNGVAQTDVINEALKDARVSPDQIDYIEAHGTGTPVGDPIELEALKRVFKSASRQNDLVIGSVKSNIGHTEAAAGAAGLLKVILAMKHAEIPRQLHFNTLNPNVEIESIPAVIPTENAPWRSSGPRYAGISSFGFSGTNAHLVVQDYPHQAKRNPGKRRTHLMCLSGHVEKAVIDKARNLADLQRRDLDDLEYTLNARRTHFRYRTTIVAKDENELIDELRSPVLQIHAQVPARKRKLAFVYTGQGSQYVNMGRQLYAENAVFKNALEHCHDVLMKTVNMDLLRLIFAEQDDTAIHQTGFTQPALFSIEYSLAALLKSWGLEPSFSIGHSLGEYVGAVFAGFMPLEDMLLVVAKRGELMQELPAGGGMVAVKAGADEVQDILTEFEATPDGGPLDIATINSPTQTVVSGPCELLEKLKSRLKAENVGHTGLTVSHAFHSRLMDPMTEKFAEVLERVSFGSSKASVISNVSGTSMQTLSTEYMIDHIRKPVQFMKGIQSAFEGGATVFLEVGPNPMLLGNVLQSAPPDASPVLLPTLKKGQDEWRTLLESMGRLYTLGYDLDWDRFYGESGESAGLLSLPAYPFQRKSFWAKEVQPNRMSANKRFPLLGEQINSASAVQSYRNKVSVSKFPYLRDHRVMGSVVMPAAAFVEMGLRAAQQFRGSVGRIAIENFSVDHILSLDSEATIEVESNLTQDQAATLTIHSYQDDRWQYHAKCDLVAEMGSAGESVRIEEIKARCRFAEATGEQFYNVFDETGLEYGESFRPIEELFVGKGEALGKLRLRASRDDYVVHPTLVDGAFQMISSLLAADRGPSPEEDSGDSATADLYLPHSIDRAELYGEIGDEIWVHVVQDPEQTTDEILAVDYSFITGAGELCLSIKTFKARKVARHSLARILDQGGIERLLYDEVWVNAKAQVSDDLTKLPCLLLAPEDQGLVERLSDALDPVSAGVHLVPFSLDVSAEGVLDVLGRCSSGDGDVRTIDVVFARPLNVVRNEPKLDELKLLFLLLQELQGDRVPLAVRRFVVLTRGAHPIGDAHVALDGAPLNGFLRTAFLEIPRYEWLHLDFDVDADAEILAEQLRQEMLTAFDETHVAYRDHGRFIARLRNIGHARRQRNELTLPRGANYRLKKSQSGVVKDVKLEEIPVPKPLKYEILVEIKAIGLNFRDVLDAMNLYESEVGPLGGDFAGRALSVPEGVTHIKPGDLVFGIAWKNYSHLSVSIPPLVARLPKGLSFAEAAQLPIIFLTGIYGLETLADLKSGETVLIHAAAGGVGLAAIQLAKRIGAQVIATASKPKWDYLKEACGLEHVFDSRSLSFKDEVLRVTGGRGVDVVLNSLSGEGFIEATLAVCAEEARFIEIGRRNVWSEEEIKAARGDVAYHRFNIDDLTLNESSTITAMLLEVSRRIEAKEIAPVLSREYPITELLSAFEAVKAGKHRGKIVIHIPTPAESFRFSEDASYVVAGGLGELGLKLAAWLVANGARHIALLSRRTPDAVTQSRIAGMNEEGAEVTAVQVDIADLEGVTQLLTGLNEGGRPVRGVFNLAGVLDDAPLDQLTWERYEKVLTPKVTGSWNLHLACESLGLELDHFVLFSSSTALHGSPAQSNYTAANAFLDLLTHDRRQQGRVSQSIRYSAWAEGGMAVGLEERLARAGVTCLDPFEALEALKLLMVQNDPTPAVMEMDWGKFASMNPSATRYLEDLTVKTADVGRGRLLGKLLEAPVSDREEVLDTAIRQSITRILAVPHAENADEDQPLNELGMDSLLALELGNLIQIEFDIRLDMASMAGANTIRNFREVLIAGSLSKHFDGAGTARESGQDKQRANGTGSEAIVAAAWDRGHNGALVNIRNPKSKEAPVVFIPGADGLSNTYHALAQALDLTCPCYIMQDPLFSDTTFGSMEEKASYYVDAIRDLPELPSCIIGWSMGGTLGYEICRILETQDSFQGRLVMFDGIYPDRELDKRMRVYAETVGWVLRRAGIAESVLADLLVDGGKGKSEQAICENSYELLKAEGKMEESLTLGDYGRFLETIHRNFVLLGAYAPAGRISEIILVMPKTDVLRGYYDSLTAGNRWKEHSMKSIVEKEIDADHFSIVDAGARSGEITEWLKTKLGKGSA